MPELPEVEALSRFLADRAGGATVRRADLATFSALKTFDPPLDAVVGRKIVGARRWGKYLGLDLDGMWLIMHLARGGWVHWRDEVPAARPKLGKGPLALRVTLDSGAGFDVTEQGTEKRLALWIVRSPEEVEGIDRLGPDPLAPGFDVEALRSVLAARPGNLKTVLTDQSALAGVGNAYSDEALHLAKLSPYKPSAKLTDAELERLYQALVAVLGEAAARSSGLPASGLKSDKKSNLRVHGRAGQACPECGDTIRQVSYATKSFQYCPTCQTGGKPLADRRLSRLLK
ncbi:MAG TPA: DNA-formamidopyrimidine glycosylase family protein [Acidimicrobiales bacterium]|jgi:formamidopyrimidine-DNA glycosylase|nr:DNA-formamidopyrimidine glycosylase family protein [Acidimicrobiales bacterium]